MRQACAAAKVSPEHRGMRTVAVTRRVEPTILVESEAEGLID